jgi:hypothetical protein
MCLITASGPGCVTIDLVSGAAKVIPLPDGFEPNVHAPHLAPKPSPFHLDVRAGALELCEPGKSDGEDCQPTKILAPTAADTPFTYGVSDDGELIFTTVESRLSIYRRASADKPAATMQLAERGPVQWVGRSLAVVASKSGKLLDAQGATIATIGGKPPADMRHFRTGHAGGDVWAFDDGGARLVFQDVRSGAIIARVEWQALGLEPDDDGDIGVVLVGTDPGLVVIDRGGGVMLLDQKGKLVRRLNVACPSGEY